MMSDTRLLKRDPSESLKGIDYVNMALHDLMAHPDYNGHIHRTIGSILGMTNEQLELIDVSNIPKIR
jgi:hypothetical protein